MAQRWRDRLRPATFRGVRFLVDSAEYEGGRRGPDHEFPDRDEPYAADTGRKQVKYKFEAYMVGPDYFAGKKKLIQALEKKGPGDLIHPYYGKKRIVVRGFTAKETAGAGGFVSFSLDLVEAGKLSFPKTGKDAPFLVGLAGKLLGAGAANALQDGLNVVDQAQFVVDSATDKVLSVCDQMDSISASITGAADPLAEFAFAVRSIRASVGDLILSPVALYNNIADAFGLLLGAFEFQGSFKFSRSFFAFGSNDPAVPQTTATRVTEARNQRSLNQAIQTIAVTTAALSAVDATFTSTDEALETQSAITEQLDALMESTDNDEVYSALQNMRTQVAAGIPGETQDLAEVTELTPTSTLPSLVLSYDLYGSVDQEQDIIDRNDISHPGFILGGRPLEVLDRG